MKSYLTIIAAVLVTFLCNGQSIAKSSIDSGGAFSQVSDIQILYSLGEFAVNEAIVGPISISEGFINSFTLNITVNPKVFLQGSYTSPSNMRDNLRTSYLITLSTPYSDGISTTQQVLDVTGNNAIVDWIWVEIRDKFDFTNILESTSALLQRNGSIVAADGVSPLSFNLIQGYYYVAISHYNHLGIVTNSSRMLKSGTTVDLTSNLSLIRGGSNAVTDMLDGNYALSAGDVDGNGQIQNTDLDAILPLLGTSSYSPADIDMNGQIQNTDISNVLQPNIGKGEQFNKNRATKSQIPIITTPRKIND